MLNKRCFSFSLIELILVIAILGVVSALAMPRLPGNIQLELSAKSMGREIGGALRLARSMAISSGTTNPGGFRFRLTGAPQYTAFEIVKLPSLEVVKTSTISEGVQCSGTTAFDFGPLGNVTSGSGTLTISGAGKTYTITVASATGSVVIE